MSERVSSRGLAAFAWVVLATLLAVVLWGAVVRATGSGAGCGDHWPLCNGDFVPHHPRLATVIEFTHRGSTGFSTTLTLLLGAWIFLATEREHPARRAWLWTIFFLVLEAIFGAVLVLKGYVVNNTSPGRIVMQVVHFTNTLLLMAAMTLTAWLLGRRRTPRAAEPGAHTLATVAVVATMITGAAGALAALADTLFPSATLAAGILSDFSASSPLLVRMRWMHPAAALVALVCAWMLGRRMSATGSRAAGALLILAVIQVLLGIGDMVLLAPVWLQVLHLLGADLFWMALVIVAAETRASPVPVAV